MSGFTLGRLPAILTEVYSGFSQPLLGHVGTVGFIYDTSVSYSPFMITFPSYPMLYNLCCWN